MLSGAHNQFLTLKDDQGAMLAEYVYYPEAALLYVRWHGHLTGSQIVQGVQQATAWREQFRYSYILNDKSDTSGDWSDALPWLQYEWLPTAVAAEIRAMAYVFSPDRENGFASLEFVTAVRPHFAIELFENLADALVWLMTFDKNRAPAADQQGAAGD